jgi:chemotaxis protein MotD
LHRKRRSTGAEIANVPQIASDATRLALSEQAAKSTPRAHADRSGRDFAQLLDAEGLPQAQARPQTQRKRALSAARQPEPTHAPRADAKPLRSQDARRTQDRKPAEATPPVESSAPDRAADSAAASPALAERNEAEERTDEADAADDALAEPSAETPVQPSEVAAAVAALLPVDTLATVAVEADLPTPADDVAVTPPAPAALPVEGLSGEVEAGATTAQVAPTAAEDQAAPDNARAAASVSGESDATNAALDAERPTDTPTKAAQAAGAAPAAEIASGKKGDASHRDGPAPVRNAVEPPPDAKLPAEPVPPAPEQLGQSEEKPASSDRPENSTGGHDVIRDQPSEAHADTPRVNAAPVAGEPAGQSFVSATNAGIAAIGATQPVHATAAASSGADAPVATVPVEMLGVEIASQAQGGRQRFDIRLDPPDLGQIHVRLDVDRDGNVVSRLVVDRAETLDLLRREAPQLERALQDAGLKTDGQAMQFLLRDQGGGGQGGRDDARPAPAARPEIDPIPVEALTTYGRRSSRAGGLDIRV